MRKLVPICALFLVCGCQQKVAVPTAQELIDDRRLLTEWQTKCDTGEYSHLAETERARLCSTTHDTTISVAEAATATSASDFYDGNTERK